MLDEVPHNEEVRSETHVDDDFDFKGKSLDNFLWHLFAPTKLCAFVSEVL